jgi:hypothetical protein
VLAEAGLGNARRTGLRINVDRQPSREEMLGAVRRYRLSCVTFTVS